MDVFQTVSGYITKMVSAGDGQAGSNAAKMKILLLDAETVSVQDMYMHQHGKLTLIGPNCLFCNHTICPPQPRGLSHRVQQLHYLPRAA